MTSYEFYVCKYGGKAIQPDEWQTAFSVPGGFGDTSGCTAWNIPPTAPAIRLYVPLLTPSAGLPMYRAVLRLLRPALRLAA